jgi:beta-glucanase (GH16 family)
MVPEVQRTPGVVGMTRSSARHQGRRYGNGEWPAGTTVHADPLGTAFETQPIGVDGEWHTWRVTWNQGGFYFWEDYVDGKEPYFSVPSTGIEDST